MEPATRTVLEAAAGLLGGRLGGDAAACWLELPGAGGAPPVRVELRELEGDDRTRAYLAGRPGALSARAVVAVGEGTPGAHELLLLAAELALSRITRRGPGGGGALAVEGALLLEGLTAEAAAALITEVGAVARALDETSGVQP